MEHSRFARESPAVKTLVSMLRTISGLREAFSQVSVMYLFILRQLLSHVRLLGTPWTVCGPTRLLCPGDSPGKNTGAGATPSSRGSSWSPPPPPGDLPDPGMGPQSPALAGGFFTTELPGKPMAAGEGFIFSSKEQVPATVVFLLSSSSLQHEMTPGSKQPFLP